MFDFTPYGTKTTDEVLKIVKGLKFKSYSLVNNKDSYGHENLKENFFIWQKGRSQEFLRLILMSRGWNSKKRFYWEIDFSFKPFNYKHNSKIENHWQSEEFKGSAEDLYLNRFLEAVEQIKNYIKLKGGLKNELYRN